MSAGMHAAPPSCARAFIASSRGSFISAGGLPVIKCNARRDALN